MFINCKHCGSLVATDPVTDAPPERCPRCRGALRASQAAAAAVSVASLLRPAAPAPADVAPASDVVEADVPPDEAVSAERTVVERVPPPTPASARTPAAADVAASAPGAAQAASGPAQGIPGVASEAPPTQPPPAALPVPAPTPSPAPQRAAASAVTMGAGAGRPSPSFARRLRNAGAAGSQRQQRWLVAGVVALSLLLVLQLLLADRDRLARDAGWRPLLTSLCGVLRCTLPAWREPEALTLLARDVRPSPGAPDQLLVSATFRNDARWPQAWPQLRLSLSDIDGRALGTRTFMPDEYLAGEGAAAPSLAAGQSANVQLVLREPEGGAVSFAFDFL